LLRDDFQAKIELRDARIHEVLSSKNYKFGKWALDKVRVLTKPFSRS
jgi:hypothetical protein